MSGKKENGVSAVAVCRLGEGLSPLWPRSISELKSVRRNGFSPTYKIPSDFHIEFHCLSAKNISSCAGSRQVLRGAYGRGDFGRTDHPRFLLKSLQGKVKVEMSVDQTNIHNTGRFGHLKKKSPGFQKKTAERYF